jgi:CRISPR-associated endonuclease Csy4
MKHYIDITLLQNDEIGHYFLWSKIYQQLHLALVEQGHGQVGLAFPEYSSGQPRLGRKLRVFGSTVETLEKLGLSKWLRRLVDYCHLTSIRPVPEHTQYAVFSRKQCDTNPERLARRRAKRKDETYEQALAHFAGFEGVFTTLPFVDLTSLSTTLPEDKSHRFKLFIERKFCKSPQNGEFSCYGLSKTATVPWF